MKLKAGFLTHATKGEHYTISTYETEFKGVVRSNETAAVIVECLKNDTTEAAIVDRLMSEYTGADRPTVERDVANIISKFRAKGIIED
ncbi:MAG: PqqD family protein [Oscillospiraceae bacterium]|nr:PqqD family protein [Oscillospiraceae bacterium]